MGRHSFEQLTASFQAPSDLVATSRDLGALFALLTFDERQWFSVQ
jgi:hypothetical protein